MATYTPPERQKFNKSINDYVSQANQAVSGRYDSRIAGEQANLPLIQQQYQQLADTIKTNQAQQEGTMKKDAVSSIGAARLRNAMSGIFSSSENRAEERNTRDDMDTTISNLAANVANTLKQAETEKQQRTLGIENVIRNLQADKEGDIQNTAFKLYDSDYQRFDNEQDDIYNRYMDTYNAQRQAEQDAFNQMIEQRKLASSSSQANTEMLSRIYDSVFYDPEGNPKNQDQVYRDLQQNANYYKTLGVDPEMLWQSWRNLKYGSNFGTGLSQEAINAAARQRPDVARSIRSGGLSTGGGLSSSTYGGRRVLSNTRFK